MKIIKPNRKYHFMIGTTSRVPDRPGWHYLILDIDEKEVPDPLYQFLHKCRFEIQKTKKGWHIYTDQIMRLRKMIFTALSFGADRTWAKLALARGWAFLADKSHIKIPWTVERKIIGWHTPTTQAQKNFFAQAKQKQKEKKECSRTSKIHSKRSAT